jgi:hypothetical protein
MNGQHHAPAALPPGTHWIGGWVGPRAGLEDVEKRKLFTLPGLGLPDRSQSLYRLRYPSSYLVFSKKCVSQRNNQIQVNQ